MKSNYLKPALLALLLAFPLCLAACGKAEEEPANVETENQETSSDETVSAEAEKIIQAMMTCPNPDLFDPDAVTVIGENAEAASEQSAQAEGKWEEIASHWEEEVGDCFADGVLDSFLSEAALTWLSEAEAEDVTISVESIDLLEKGDVTEKVQVTILKGEETEEVEFIFHHDSDGLVTKIEMS